MNTPYHPCLGWIWRIKIGSMEDGNEIFNQSKKVNFSWNCIENLSHFHCYYFSEEACVSIECSLRSVLHISRNSTLSSANMCVIHPPMCVIQLPICVPVVIVCQNVGQFLGNSSVRVSRLLRLLCLFVLVHDSSMMNWILGRFIWVQPKTFFFYE